MDRKTIYDRLIPLYPTYWIGQNQSECTKTYLVIKYKDQSASVKNSQCGWQLLEVMIYVPISSPANMEKALNDVKGALKDIIEPTGNITPDFLDTDVKAIMRSIEFRYPKEVI